MQSCSPVPPTSRFIEKHQELEKTGDLDEEKLFEETAKALLAEGIVLRRRGGATVSITGYLHCAETLGIASWGIGPLSSHIHQVLNRDNIKTILYVFFPFLHQSSPGCDSRRMTFPSKIFPCWSERAALYFCSLFRSFLICRACSWS